ncbi:hypothetical protein GCM10026982_58700 [Nocardiopsis aegyptia]
MSTMNARRSGEWSVAPWKSYMAPIIAGIVLIRDGSGQYGKRRGKRWGKRDRRGCPSSRGFG